jgi:hypothetical protein
MRRINVRIRGMRCFAGSSSRVISPLSPGLCEHGEDLGLVHLPNCGTRRKRQMEALC